MELHVLCPAVNAEMVQPVTLSRVIAYQDVSLAGLEKNVTNVCDKVKRLKKIFTSFAE